MKKKKYTKLRYYIHEKLERLCVKEVIKAYIETRKGKKYKRSCWFSIVSWIEFRIRSGR